MTKDILVNDQGSIVLLHPLTDAAKEWIGTNISDDAQYFGRALVVEPRYVDDILCGMQADGLLVSF